MIGREAAAHRQWTDIKVRDTGRRPPPLVSADELAILRLVAHGLPIDAVAHRLATSPRTVRRRMRNLGDRVGATCTIQAVVWAARHGLV
jgi:DNA-binding NarL/FixJ family response regulator